MNINKFIYFTIDGVNRTSSSSELLDIYTEALKIIQLYFTIKDIFSTFTNENKFFKKKKQMKVIQ